MSANDESDSSVPRNNTNATNDSNITTNSNSNNNSNCKLHNKYNSDEEITELNTEESVENKNSERDLKEEKEGSKEGTLSYCRGLSEKPLAVPMVADTLQQSVTRNDAKAITETRLKRLKELSQRPEEQLSKDQKDEKKRIIRLEKNRRAAAMSRRKKKMYVKGLEDKYTLMARHLAILEMENSHLRALLNASSNIPTNVPTHFKFNQTNIPNFQIPSMPNFASNNNNNDTNSNSNNETTNNSTTMNSIEPTNISESVEISNNNENNSEHPRKRRKLNDNSITPVPSLSCDNSDDISVLEPLPITNTNNSMVPPAPPTAPPALPPSIPVSFMHQSHLLPPNITNIHPSRLMPYHAAHHLHQRMPQYMNNINNNSKKNQKVVETICIENDEINNNKKNKDTIESKSIEIDEMELDNNNNKNDIPPDIVVPRLSNEFLSISDMNDDIIDETVDECGTIIPFQQENQQNNNVVYL